MRRRVRGDAGGSRAFATYVSRGVVGGVREALRVRLVEEPQRLPVLPRLEQGPTGDVVAEQVDPVQAPRGDRVRGPAVLALAQHAVRRGDDLVVDSPAAEGVRLVRPVQRGRPHSLRAVRRSRGRRARAGRSRRAPPRTHQVGVLLDEGPGGLAESIAAGLHFRAAPSVRRAGRSQRRESRPRPTGRAFVAPAPLGLRPVGASRRPRRRPRRLPRRRPGRRPRRRRRPAFATVRRRRARRLRSVRARRRLAASPPPSRRLAPRRRGRDPPRSLPRLLSLLPVSIAGRNHVRPPGYHVRELEGGRNGQLERERREPRSVPRSGAGGAEAPVRLLALVPQLESHGAKHRRAELRTVADHGGAVRHGGAVVGPLQSSDAPGRPPAGHFVSSLQGRNKTHVGRQRQHQRRKMGQWPQSRPPFAPDRGRGDSVDVIGRIFELQEIRLRRGLGAWAWEEICMAMIGEQFDVGEEICGAVVNIRSHEVVLAVWHRTASDQAASACIQDTIRQILNLPPWTVLEYKIHGKSLRAATFSTSTVPPPDQNSTS